MYQVCYGDVKIWKNSVRWVENSAHEYVEIVRVKGERMRGISVEIARAIGGEKCAWKRIKTVRGIRCVRVLNADYQDSENFNNRLSSVKT